MQAEKRGKVGSVASKEGRREIDGELGLELGLLGLNLAGEIASKEGRRSGDGGRWRRPTTGDDGTGDMLLLLRPLLRPGQLWRRRSRRSGLAGTGAAAAPAIGTTAADADASRDAPRQGQPQRRSLSVEAGRLSRRSPATPTRLLRFREPTQLPPRAPSPSLSSSELATSRTAAAAAAAATAAALMATTLPAILGEGREEAPRLGSGGSELALRSRLEVPGIDCERGE